MLSKEDTVYKNIKAPPTKTLKQLRVFLGLASFYGKYVPDFSVIAASLTDATNKGKQKEITWDEVRERAFQELKRRISHVPILKLPDVSEPFILQKDASHVWIGTVLSKKVQLEKSGQLFLRV